MNEGHHIGKAASVASEANTDGTGFFVPTAYAKNSASARRRNAAVADNYLKHATVGDTLLDPVFEELESLPLNQLHEFIGAGIEGREEQFKRAPRVLRKCFDELNSPPPWFNYSDCELAVRAFHANSHFILVAFVAGVLIEGFSTMIAKSFNMTGRVALTPERRLKQNNRHIIEVFFPEGVKRFGDGWKLSTRIRFVHARVRQLLSNSGKWDSQAWGTPISAAHMGFALCVFSMRLVQQSTLLGARFSKADRDSFIYMWRYVGHLMGIPDQILLRDFDDAQVLYKTALMCEPPPGEDSVAMANALVKSVPIVANIEDPDECKNVEELVYRLSRALIGRKLANQLEFPQDSRIGMLAMYRFKQRFARFTKSEHLVRSDDFMQILDASQYDQQGMSYELPDHADARLSNFW